MAAAVAELSPLAMLRTIVFHFMAAYVQIRAVPSLLPVTKRSPEWALLHHWIEST